MFMFVLISNAKVGSRDDQVGGLVDRVLYMHEPIASSPWVYDSDTHPLVFGERHENYQMAFMQAMVKMNLRGGAVSFAPTLEYRCLVKLRPIDEKWASSIDMTPVVNSALDKLRSLIPPIAPIRGSGGGVGMPSASIPPGWCKERVAANTAFFQATTRMEYDRNTYYMTPEARIGLVVEALDFMDLGSCARDLRQFPYVALWLLSTQPASDVRRSIPFWDPNSLWATHGILGVHVGFPGNPSEPPASYQPPSVGGVSGDSKRPVMSIESCLYVVYMVAIRRMIQLSIRPHFIDGLLTNFVDALVHSSSNVAAASPSITAIFETPCIVSAIKANPALKSTHTRVTSTLSKLRHDHKLTSDLAQIQGELNGTRPPLADSITAATIGARISDCKRDEKLIGCVLESSYTWSRRRLRTMKFDAFIKQLMRTYNYSALRDTLLRLPTHTTIYLRIDGTSMLSVIASLRRIVPLSRFTTACYVSAAARGTRVLLAIERVWWCIYQSTACGFYVDSRPSLGGSSMAHVEARKNSCVWTRLSIVPIALRLWCSTAPECYIAFLNHLRKWNGMSVLDNPMKPTTVMRSEMLKTALRKTGRRDITPDIAARVFGPLLAIQDSDDFVFNAEDPIHAAEEKIVTRRAPAPCTPSPARLSQPPPSSIPMVPGSAMATKPWSRYYTIIMDGWVSILDADDLLACANAVRYKSTVRSSSAAEDKEGADIQHPDHVLLQRVNAKPTNEMVRLLFDSCSDACDDHGSRLTTICAITQGLEALYHGHDSKRVAELPSWLSVTRPSLPSASAIPSTARAIPILHTAVVEQCFHRSSYPIGVTQGPRGIRYVHVDDKFFDFSGVIDEKMEMCERFRTLWLEFNDRLKPSMFARWNMAVAPRAAVVAPSSSMRAPTARIVVRHHHHHSDASESSPPPKEKPTVPSSSLPSPRATTTAGTKHPSADTGGGGTEKKHRMDPASPRALNAALDALCGQRQQQHTTPSPPTPPPAPYYPSFVKPSQLPTAIHSPASPIAPPPSLMPPPPMFKLPSIAGYNVVSTSSTTHMTTTYSTLPYSSHHHHPDAFSGTSLDDPEDEIFGGGGSSLSTARHSDNPYQSRVQ